jgi:FKBP-type peptidyl-prolyl cis-trans isomerase
MNKSVYVVAASLFAGGLSLHAAAGCCPPDAASNFHKASDTQVQAFSEAELFTILGQFMAFSGGVYDLKFSDDELAVFAEGMALPLVEADAFEAVEDAQIEAAVEEAMARLEAAEAGEELPALSANTPRYLGYVVALQSGIVGLGLSAEEGERVRGGALIGARLEAPTEGMQAAMEPLSALMDARIQKLMAEQGLGSADDRSAEEHKAEAEAFLAQLAEVEADLKVTDSGLRFLILEEGNGDKPSSSDTVRVHYHGTLIDGTVFDSSVQRGQPADFPLRGVVPGFAEGLQQVGEGGKVRLFIPSHLAYGDQARPGSPIPGGALIIFDCELLAVNP